MKLYDIEDPNPRETKQNDEDYILEETLIEEINKVRESLPKSLSSIERIEKLKLFNTFGTTSNVEVNKKRKIQRILGRRGVKNRYNYYAILDEDSYMTLRERIEWRRHTDYLQRILQIKHLLRRSPETRFSEKKYWIIMNHLYEDFCVELKFSSEYRPLRRFWEIIVKELNHQYLEYLHTLVQ